MEVWTPKGARWKKTRFLFGSVGCGKPLSSMLVEHSRASSGIENFVVFSPEEEVKLKKAACIFAHIGTEDQFSRFLEDILAMCFRSQVDRPIVLHIGNSPTVPICRIPENKPRLAMQFHKPSPFL